MPCVDAGQAGLSFLPKLPGGQPQRRMESKQPRYDMPNTPGYLSSFPGAGTGDSFLRYNYNRKDLRVHGLSCVPTGRLSFQGATGLFGR